MKTLIIPITLMIMTFGAGAQEITVYENFESYKHLLNKNNDTTYVINYWATYCAPCIKEMPVFKRLENEYSGKKMEIILTSLDFGGNPKEKVRSFMNRHGVKSRVVILDDPDSNSWIDKVSTQWSGALPGTLIYNNNFREFYEQTFTYDEINSILKSKMIKP